MSSTVTTTGQSSDAEAQRAAVEPRVAGDATTSRERGEAAVATPPRPLPRAYLTAWATTACVSAGYLAVIAVATPDANEASGDAPTRRVQSAEGASATDPARAEARVMKLKLALEDFQRDIASLRRDYGSAKTEQARSDTVGDRDLLARLAALEERLSIDTGIAVERIAPQPLPLAVMAGTDAIAAPEAAAEPPQPAPGAGTVGVTGGPRVAGALVTVTNGETRMSIPLETGSVARPPVKPGQADSATLRQQVAVAAAPPIGSPGSATRPVVINQQTPPAVATAAAAQPPAPVPPPKPFALQLASGASVQSLRLSWSVLSEQHADALRALEPRLARTATPGAFDLMAGPFKTAADARKACKTLASRGVDCKIATFQGEGL